MSHNPYIAYYKQQAGTGISGFQGYRYQRGHGFFGRLISKAVFPLFKFLGQSALATGANIASDVIVNKRNLKEAAKEHLESAGKDIANAGIQRAKKFVLEGKGRKRKKTIKSLELENLIKNVRIKKKARRR